MLPHLFFLAASSLVCRRCSMSSELSGPELVLVPAWLAPEPRLAPRLPCPLECPGAEELAEELGLPGWPSPPEESARSRRVVLRLRGCVAEVMRRDLALDATHAWNCCTGTGEGDPVRHALHEDKQV